MFKIYAQSILRHGFIREFDQGFCVLKCSLIFLIRAQAAKLRIAGDI